MPTVSADGRTYTFRIRAGFRFSPPSGQAVTAQTFRLLARARLLPKYGPGYPGMSVLSDIVGAAAYNSGRVSHVSGITVRGSQLSIRLKVTRRRFSDSTLGAVLLPGSNRDARGRGRSDAADPVSGPVLRRLEPGRRDRLASQPELQRPSAPPDRAHRLHDRYADRESTGTRRRWSRGVHGRLDQRDSDPSALGPIHPRHRGMARRAARRGATTNATSSCACLAST